ncbi:MAG: hypothetical protein JWO91_3243 [Acidobacteriaceae bacterium]|nr:hypothetical protein [Acidobacteriaceae bacterium]
MEAAPHKRYLKELSSRAFLCMHPALRNHLAIKVCELLDQPDVLK